MGNIWAVLFMIYAAPSNSVDWPGPWNPGMTVAEKESFFHSEAECRNYAIQKIGRTPPRNARSHEVSVCSVSCWVTQGSASLNSCARAPLRPSAIKYGVLANQTLISDGPRIEG